MSEKDPPETQPISHADKQIVQDWSFQQLTEVPGQLLESNLTHIQVLHLNNNRLGSIPPQLCTSLPHLRKVRLDSNELVQLPVEISLWTQLEVLQLNENWYTLAFIFVVFATTLVCIFCVVPCLMFTHNTVQAAKCTMGFHILYDTAFATALARQPIECSKFAL
jgi:hypothetical protein